MGKIMLLLATLFSGGLQAEELWRVRLTAGMAGPGDSGAEVAPEPTEPLHTADPASYGFLGLGLERSLGPRHGLVISAEHHFQSPFDASRDLLYCLFGSCGHAQFHTWSVGAGPYYRRGPLQFSLALRWHPDPYATYSEDGERTTEAFEDAFGIAGEAEYQFSVVAVGLRYEWVEFAAVDEVYVGDAPVGRINGSNFGAFLAFRF